MEKALVMIGDRLHHLDVIQLKDEILIVFQWFWNEEQQLRRPEFVLPLTSVAHQLNETDPRLPRYLVSGDFPANIGDADAHLQRNLIGIRKGPDLVFPLAETPLKH